MASSTQKQIDSDHNDGRRVRELYRYFQPERVAAQNQTDDILPPATAAALEASAAPPSPALSAHHSLTPAAIIPEALVLGEYNATLNSFAQLAALRLNVERVLISVSDRDSQFIIAQSSQSLIGAKKDYESIIGGFFDGCPTISSSAWAMCKDTVALPPSDRDCGQFSFMVVNDLSEDDRYKRLPFVQGDPSFRFYAGTPLTTDNSVNLGCFFLLDTKPHDGLTDSEKEIMGSLGFLIMNFLKVSRQASEGRRAARLSRGLSCFVEGSSSFVDSVHPSYAGSSSHAPSTPPSSSQRAHHLSIGSFNSSENPSRRSHSTDAQSSSSVSDFKGDQGISSGPVTPLPEWWSGSRHKELKRLDESHGNSWAFRRAANLIRESLELEGDGGVVFLEAGNSPSTEMDAGSDILADAGDPAPVLAISTSDEPFAPGPGSKFLCPAANLDSGFLHRLLRRYAKGKLWSFHRDGVVSSSDDERAKPLRSRSRASKSPDLVKSASKKWKSVENSILNLYFPNATQVLFVPLWNAANSQWFAGCFCWNTVETRVFTPSVELSSILGFGSSIMVECSRVESLISDRQKGDFIGSISHELRSPLHGILAAAEFLNGTNLDEFQGSLLETINACGRTLLDTMNQVLDFSKIVSLERKSRQMKRSSKPSALEVKNQSAAHLDTYVETDLALLAEEVVEGVCLGHAYSQKSSAPYNQMANIASDIPKMSGGTHSSPQLDVEVVMDIAQNDWVYQTQPGALRRIIMNVFGNAMKYTEAGRVSLHLEVTESSEGRSRKAVPEDLVTLTISDTGKGISEEFLRGRLYTPFAQEDTLAVGTGLGLSIVRSLVKSMNGSINIHSRPGEGTIVKVSLPLARPELDLNTVIEPQSQYEIRKDSANEFHLLRQNHDGRCAAILGMEPTDAAKDPMWSIISGYLTDWYGLQLVPWPSQEQVDILLADEAGLLQDIPRDSNEALPPLLILCNRAVDYSTAQSQWSSLSHFVSITRRPCGPHKLARTVRKCLDSQLGTSARQCIIDLPERPRRKDTLISNSPSDPEGNFLEIPSDAPDLTDGTSSSAPSVSMKSTPSQSDIPDPITTASSSPPPLNSPLLVTPTKPFPERRARVLVVDDNSINLSLMLTFMKKRSLEALNSAENGKIAVDSVEQMLDGYDLIFMDMSMPVMNGFEATRAIRALEKERGEAHSTSAIIIALTGLSSSKDETEALASGVDLFLTKPVSFKEVSRLLDEWEDKGLNHRRYQHDTN